MNPNLKVGDAVILHQNGMNYHYTLTRIYSADECPEPACRLQNGIGEMICRQSEVEPEAEFKRRREDERREQLRIEHAAIISAWNDGLRKTKDIAERMNEENTRSLGLRISACKRWGLIADELSELEELICWHKFLYYKKAAPTISDYEYDMLEQRLKKEHLKSAVLNDPKYTECPEAMWVEYEKQYASGRKNEPQ